MASESELLRLEKKIERYRKISQQVDAETAKRIHELVADLERNLTQKDSAVAGEGLNRKRHWLRMLAVVIQNTRLADQGLRPLT
jgi:hypothetical protein